MSTLPPSTVPFCLCSELIYAILVLVPARDLIKLKIVDSGFTSIINGILKTRLLKLTPDSTHELIFESSEPAYFRNSPKSVLKFDGFSDNSINILSATYSISSQNHTNSFILDDGELFSSYLMEISLARKNSKSILGNMSLASGTERLWKYWFTTPEPKPTYSSLQRKISMQTLYPSSSSFLKAEIECKLNETESEDKFEFFFKEILVDVGKVVAAMEKASGGIVYMNA